MPMITVQAGEAIQLPYNERGYSPLALSNKYILLRDCRRTAVFTYIVGGPFDGKGFRTSSLWLSDRAMVICEECGCVGGIPSGTCIKIPSTIDSEHLVCPTCPHTFCRHCYMPSRTALCTICSFPDRPVYYSGLTTKGIAIRTATLARLGRSAFPVISLWERDGVALLGSFPFIFEPNLLILHGNASMDGESEADITEEAQDNLRRENLWIHIVDKARMPVYITTDIQGSQVFQHYHTGCWGDMHFSIGSTPEQKAQLAHDVLTVINARSPAREHPSGLPYSAYSIPHGPIRRTNIWSTERIRVLTEQERLMRDILSRQQGVGLEVPESIMVVGCGGVGWNTAMQAALIGVQRILLVDHDRLELSNLSRLAGSRFVGEYKATALKTVIDSYTWRDRVLSGEYTCSAHYGRIQSLDHCLTRQWFISRFGERYTRGARLLDVILDTTDDIATQRFVYQMARECGARYIRAGYDGGWHVTVSSRCAPEWEVEGTAPGYRVAAWIGGSQFVASMAITKMCYRPELEISVDLRDMLSLFHQQDMVVSGEELNPVPVLTDDLFAGLEELGDDEIPPVPVIPPADLPRWEREVLGTYTRYWTI